MLVRRLSHLTDLEPLRAPWRGLTRGVPLLGWEWLATWWGHYGPPTARGSELFCLAVVDAQATLRGLAPWYLRRGVQGRQVLFLGSGEVCTDYLTVLSAPGWEARVAESLADWLGDGRRRIGSSRPYHPDDAWDQMEFTGVDAGDPMMAELMRAFRARGLLVHERPGPNCWRLDLPSTWDEYVARLSKSHRKQVGRCQRRVFDTGRARLTTVADESQLQRGLEVLVELHQRRRRSLGDAGRFADPRFDGFLRAAAERAWQSGTLSLHWLELDSRPVAAEFHLAGTETLFAYQSGVDPDALDEEAGRLVTMATLQRAIERGYRSLDFLRGDEAYKAHWRAEPRPSKEYRVIGTGGLARIRHGVWLAGQNVKRWMRGRATPGALRRETQPNSHASRGAPSPETENRTT